MKKFLAIILCLAMMVSVVAVSTFATEEPEYDVLPIVDGEVEADEYEFSRAFDNANCFTVCTLPTGVESVTITDYAAHDDTWIYLAWVIDLDMQKIEVRMNGQDDIRTSFYAPEFIYYLTYEFGADMDTADLGCSRGNFGHIEGFDSEAGEIYGKASKIYEGDEVVATHFEMKILKEAAKRVFEVESIDALGYYISGRPAANGEIVNAGRFKTWGDSGFSGTEAFANAYGTDSGTANPSKASYNNRWRLLNFFVFGEKPTEYNHYCSADAGCASAGHANRATELDLADLSQFGVVPSNYVERQLVPAPPATTTEATTTEPTTAEPTTAEPTTAEPTTAEPTTAEPTTAEPTTAEPTTAEPTTADPTTADATTAEPTTAEATTKAATTAATTAAEEKGCGKSIALSALAIVPVLGLGVAVVSKKKED